MRASATYTADYPETAKGKRLEARAIRREAIRMLRVAEDLDGFADNQEKREARDAR